MNGRDFSLPGRSPVLATNAAAATSHPLATATALAILREGGNAVDAAIAASATLCAVEPHMTGIGGDCFAIICEPDGRLHGLNASGRAPANATLEWFTSRGIAQIGDTSPHSVTVPGALRGWQALHDRFGAMDWTRLFADAVSLAREGFPVAPRVARDWAMLTAKLLANDGARQHLLRDGKAPGAGERFRLEALGNTLEAVARDGASAFYEGEIATDIVNTVRGLGGLLRESDLAACEAEWVTPVSTSYRNHDIVELPPNGQGIVALVLLNLLEAAGEPAAADSTERYHRLAELGRIAYAVRDAHIGDPDHMTVSAEQLVSGPFARDLLGQFDPERRNANITLPSLRGSDTIYLCVVDRDGLAVSFINSVYSGFGSGIVTPRTGIALQNRGSGFRIDADHPACIGPGRRPLHTIIPGMMMRNGRAVAPFGVMGGAYQPMGHAHLVENLLTFGMDPQAALDHPRLFFNEAGSLVAEPGIPADAISGLERLGHSVIAGGPHGGGQAILIDHERGILIAGSDPRKDGHAGGY